MYYLLCPDVFANVTFWMKAILVSSVLKPTHADQSIGVPFAVQGTADGLMTISHIISPNFGYISALSYLHVCCLIRHFPIYIYIHIYIYIYRYIVSSIPIPAHLARYVRPPCGLHPKRRLLWCHALWHLGSRGALGGAEMGWGMGVTVLFFWWFYNWVCLKMGYTPNYSHLVGIMIINHWV